MPDLPPGIDGDLLRRRIRQELAAPPIDPLPAPAPILARGPEAEATVSAMPKGAIAEKTMKHRLKLLLRRIPLLGGLLAWGNSLRRLAETRRLLAEMTARQAEMTARQTALSEVQAKSVSEQGAFNHQAEERFQLISRHLSRQDGDLADLSTMLKGLDGYVTEGRRGLEALRGDVAGWSPQMTQLKSEVILLQRRLSRILETPAPAAAGAAAGTTASEPGAGPSADALDAYYAAFEDSFRGSAAEIKERLRLYLGHLPPAAPSHPVVDVGCGRGEWLELLGDAGFTAYGIDLNAVNVARGRDAGLDIRHEDALRHLRGLPDGSLAAVTAFHLIEHLPFEVLVELVEEAHRVLISGGLLICETPNPENVLVGTLTFYNDPTHRHPIPPGVARFLFENRGFAGAEVLRLHPYAESLHLPGEDDLTQRFNQYFYGPQDYAVIGRKT